MKIGYARVSTKDQNLDLQIDALKKAGCADTYIYREQITGATKDRPELINLLNSVRSGDVVVIWKLDRLGRSLGDLVNLVNQIQDKGAELQSLNDNIDTTTPQGKLTFHIFAAIAQFEREIIRERTNAGLASARARGRKGGRPPGLTSSSKIKAEAAQSLYEKKTPVNEIARTLGISKRTLYKYLRTENPQTDNQTSHREPPK
jgi:DNA invertase Pin-like site-specific DNA recombinase